MAGNTSASPGWTHEAFSLPSPSVQESAFSMDFFIMSPWKANALAVRGGGAGSVSEESSPFDHICQTWEAIWTTAGSETDPGFISQNEKKKQKKTVQQDGGGPGATRSLRVGTETTRRTHSSTRGLTASSYGDVTKDDTDQTQRSQRKFPNGPQTVHTT